MTDTIETKSARQAKALFRQMFEEASKDPGPVLPTHFVKRNIFHAKCRELGIHVSDNAIQAFQWEEEIGLPEFAHMVLAKYHKEHGSDFTPMEKGAWRLRKQ